MFKSARWRSEKNKIKAVFKLQFRATQVPQTGSEMMVCSVPLEIGRQTMRSEKVAVIDGVCQWKNPIYESLKLVTDPKTGKINEKVYQFNISTTGSSKTGILGGVTVNLADYAEVFKPSFISLPLKPSNTGAILHVTVQRMPNDGDGRQSGQCDDQRKTLQSQLSKIDDEENKRALSLKDHTNFIEGGFLKSNQAQVRFPSSRDYPVSTDSNGNLHKSQSFGAISATCSDTSSPTYTPREDDVKQNTPKDSISFLSPLARSSPLQNPPMASPLQNPMASSGDWSSTSARDESTDGSTNSSDEPGLRERSQDSDDSIEKLRSDVILLTRKVELSDVELQTLRKQVVKESKRGQDLVKEISRLKEERNELKRRCEEQTVKYIEMAPNNLHHFEEDPLSILKEIKQELNHEREMNANLRLQLQKTQEANSELLLAVRDLDELLEKRNDGMLCDRCNKMDAKVEPNKDLKDMEYEDQVQRYQKTLSKDLSLDANSENGTEEQFALDMLVKKQDNMQAAYSIEKRATDLSNEVEMYKKDREELEMQMEQLALDYEILKQENHDISLKLEQTQLREQLRMQYECSAHLSIISDLEAHVESLEKEIEQQAEAFEAGLDKILNAKVEQEKRAIQAEDTISKIKQNNVKTSEQLQEELMKLSAEMSNMYLWSEKLAIQALKETNELRLQKNHLEKLLDKRNKELAVVHGQYRMQFQQLFSLLDTKLKETDRLVLELKDKKQELENCKMSGESRLRNSLQDIESLQTEVEELKVEKNFLSENVEQKEKLLKEMEELKLSGRQNEIQLQEKIRETNVLKKEAGILRERLHELLDVISGLRNDKDEKDDSIKMLKSEIATLQLQQSDSKPCLPEDELDADDTKRSKDKYPTAVKKGLKLVLSLMEDSKKDGASNIEKESGEDIIMLNQGNTLHESTVPEIKTEDGYIMHDTNEIYQETGTSSRTTPEEVEKSDVSTFHNQHQMMEALKEAAELKEQNKLMEAELKEMQERYSAISLKFAEVEGERQQLVMRIRSSKNTSKN